MQKKKNNNLKVSINLEEIFKIGEVLGKSY